MIRRQGNLGQQSQTAGIMIANIMRFHKMLLSKGRSAQENIVI